MVGVRTSGKLVRVERVVRVGSAEKKVVGHVVRSFLWDNPELRRAFREAQQVERAGRKRR